MENRKLNEVDQVEVVVVQLCPNKTPIAYAAKVRCLMQGGHTEERAKSTALLPFEMELYYEVGLTLFAVDSEAIECGANIISFYSGEEYEEADD